MNHRHLYPLSLSALLLAAQPAAVLAQAPAAPSVSQPPSQGPTLDVSRFQMDGELPLSDTEVQALLRPHTGPQRSLRDIEAAAAALESALRSQGYAFHRIFIPAQRPVDGVVRLQVLRFKIGNVDVAGNEHFSAENIRRALPTLVEGQAPEVRTLGGDVSASNTNPAKQVQVTFKESRQPNTIDAAVRVRDIAPQSFMVSLTGNQAVTGDPPSNNTYRLSGVYQHANLFDRDHVVTLSYTTDPGDISAVSLWGAYYQLPLYGTGMSLSGYLTHSNINSGTVQQGAGSFDVSGGGRFMGLRLTKALARGSTLQHSASVALDDRVFRNKTTFGGVPLQPDVASRVLSAQYQLRDEAKWGQWSASIDYATNVGGGTHNTDASHQANGGNRRWDAWRYSLEATVPAGRWQYQARLKGQYASRALVAGEQFGLGGSQSVRGFADRVVAGDRGYQWGFEAQGPQLGEWDWRPVVFVEGGETQSLLTGVRETLMSAGAGVRLARNRLQFSADLAQVIDRPSTAQSSRPMRLHMALSYRY